MSDTSKANKYLGTTRGAAAGTTSATVQLVVPADQFFKGYATFAGTIATANYMSGKVSLGGSDYAYSVGTLNTSGANANLASQTYELTLGSGTYDVATSAAIINSAIVIYQGAFYAKD